MLIKLETGCFWKVHQRGKMYDILIAKKIAKTERLKLSWNLRLKF